MVGDVCTPWCNEAYTTIQLPANASRKGTASLHVNVDTRAGGNVLPLCVFQWLYPNQISPAGLPTGLDHVSTRFITYNGSHIPLYGALHGPITWQPGHPDAKPHQVNSYWYVGDTPGPAILGLPSSEKLEFVKMNCAITVMWPGTKPPCPAPVSTTAATTKHAIDPAAAKSIRSTDDLIKSSQINSQALADTLVNTNLTLTWCTSCDTCPQKMPHCLAPEGQGTPQQDRMPGNDHPCRWAHRLGILHYLCSEGKWQAMPVLGSPWPQQDHLLRSSQDAHCGRSHSWVCTLLLLHQVGHPPWILVNHPWPGVQPAYNIQQPLWKILFPATSFWTHLFPRHLPEEDGSDSQRVPRMHWNSRWHHCLWPHRGGTWCLPTKLHAYHPQIWLGV